MRTDEGPAASLLSTLTTTELLDFVTLLLLLKAMCSILVCAPLVLLWPTTPGLGVHDQYISIPSAWCPPTVPPRGRRRKDKEQPAPFAVFLKRTRDVIHKEGTFMA